MASVRFNYIDLREAHESLIIDEEKRKFILTLRYSTYQLFYSVYIHEEARYAIRQAVSTYNIIRCRRAHNEYEWDEDINLMRMHKSGSIFRHFSCLKLNCLLVFSATHLPRPTLP